MRSVLVGALVLAACGDSQTAKKSDSSTAGRGKGERGSVVTARQPTSPGSQAPAAGGRKTVIIVGTSLTAGLGLDPEEAYPALLQQKVDSVGLHYEIVNAGLSGETSAGALRRIDWLMRGPADVVIIETGANDGLRGLNVD